MLDHRALVLAASLVIVLPAFGQAGTFAFQEAKLVAADAALGDNFGQSVAVSGDTAVIGVDYDDDAGDSSGSAYVFLRTGTTWGQQAKLKASDAASGDSFGVSVAVSGDTAVVGAFRDASTSGADAGSAYVFVRAGTSWTQQAKLTASDAAAGNRFGFTVAVSGDTAVIGAYANDHDGIGAAGAAYVFVRSGTSWTQQAKLTASDAAPSDLFGYSVAVSGDLAVVGALLGDNGTTSDVGAAYVFARSATTWSQQAKLAGSDVMSGDNFGISVAASGDTGVVGANHDFGTGAAYVFVRSGTSWAQQAKLTAADGVNGDQFGDSVAVSGETVVVGADVDDNAGGVDAGSAYMFARSGSSWTQEAKLTASDAAAGDRFGWSVAVDWDTAVLGAFYDDDKGSAYVFRLGPFGEWTSLGSSLAGTSGTPALAGTGYLVKDLPVALSLTQAKQFSFAPLVVGVNTISAPFKGGLMVPTPDFIFPLFTDFFGKATFGGLWPTGVPSGFTTYFQWWVQDAAGPKGFAASNALAGTTP